MTLRTLRRGNRGRLVKRMQNALIHAARSDETDCLGQPFPRGRTFIDDSIFGRITQQALDAFQQRRYDEDAGFEVSHVCDRPTWEALGFSSGRADSHENTGPAAPTPTARRLHCPQGRRPGEPRPSGPVVPAVPPPDGSEMPPWMSIAWAEHARDVHELYGVASNPRIIEYLGIGHVSSALLSERGRAGNSRATDIMNRARNMDGAYQRRLERQNQRRAAAGRPLRTARTWTHEERFGDARMNTLDEVPWCAAFVGWCLAQVGYTRRTGTHDWGNNFLGARSWRPTDGSRGTPRYGAVCVKENADGDFHVGFMLTHSAGRVQFLGGNQSDRGRSGGAVNIADYVQHTDYEMLTFLWPPEVWPDVDPVP